MKRLMLAVGLLVALAGCDNGRRFVSLPTPPCPTDSCQVQEPECKCDCDCCRKGHCRRGCDRDGDD